MGFVGSKPSNQDLGKARRPRSPAVRFSAARIGLFLLLQAGPVAAQSPVGRVDYREQVHPILAANCLACHDQEKRSGGLALATYDDVLAGGRSGPAVKPGQSADSLLIARLRGEIEPQMPLGGVLGASQIDILRAWIDEGARPAPAARPAPSPWEPKLSLERPPAPAAVWDGWERPDDRIVAHYLARQGLEPPGLVPDAVFARRAFLDIWGLLPSPSELKSFLTDGSPRKRQELVERLLEHDRHYAEHWISYWNDLLRNDEGVNYYSENASRKSISSWLLYALMTNMGYDQMVLKLLNPVRSGDPDGFLTGVNWRGAVSAGQTQAMQAAQNTAQIFLGVNLKCNSCHDSFISRWKLKDAYGLAAYFSDEERLRLYRCDAPQDEDVTAAFLYSELDRPNPGSSPEARRATAAGIFTDPRNGRLPRTIVNRIFEKLLGRGIVEDADDMDGQPWSPELLDWLASEFVSNGYDLRRLIGTIVTSRAYQLPSIRRSSAESDQYSFRGPELRRLTAEQFADAVGSVTGDWRVVQTAVMAQEPTEQPPEEEIHLSVSGSPEDGAALVRAARSRGRSSRGEPDDSIPEGSFTREWRMPANNLTRALGRPVRDQVFSSRDSGSTTMQMVELANGEILTGWLLRGARAMLDVLPPEPKSLAGKQVRSGFGAPGLATFEADISGSDSLFFIIEDTLSTAPDKALPVWADVRLSGPNGSVALSALRPEEPGALREAGGPVVLGETSYDEAVRIRFPSVLSYDVSGRGFTRMAGVAGFEGVDQFQVGETANARFYVFDEKPSLDRLTPPKPGTPVPPPDSLANIPETVDRVYWHLLCRAPSAQEREVASDVLRSPDSPGSPSPEGLADLLWAIMMTPEFQFIR